PLKWALVLPPTVALAVVTPTTALTSPPLAAMPSALASASWSEVAWTEIVVAVRGVVAVTYASTAPSIEESAVLPAPAPDASTLTAIDVATASAFVFDLENALTSRAPLVTFTAPLTYAFTVGVMVFSLIDIPTDPPSPVPMANEPTPTLESM